MTTETIRRIIKDYKFPIPLIPEHYEYFFDLYESFLGTNTVKKQLETEILKSGLSEEEYLEKLYFVQNEIIDKITSSSIYSDFNDEKNPLFVGKDALYSQKTCTFNFTRKTDVYQPDNVGKKFISVDLEKANFQICKKYSPDLVLGSQSYEDLIKKFIDSDYMVGSKYIRQIIFGNLAPKRQNRMEQYYTGKILTFLIQRNHFKENDIRVYTSDELVFNAEEFLTEDKQKEIYDDIYREFGLKTHIESYSVKDVFKNLYAKEFSDGKVVFKGVPNLYYAQVYKKYFGGTIDKRDLMFIHENNVAYFEKSLAELETK